MPTNQSIQLVVEMRKILKEKRLSFIDDRTGKPISLRGLAVKGDLDVAILHRSEDSTKPHTPSLEFFLDHCESLDIDLQTVVDEAKERIR